MLNTVRGAKYFQPDSHTPLYHTSIYHSSHLHQYFHFDMLFAKQKTSYYGKHIWQSCLGGISWRHPSSRCSPLQAVSRRGAMARNGNPVLFHNSQAFKAPAYVVTKSSIIAVNEKWLTESAFFSFPFFICKITKIKAVIETYFVVNSYFIK